MFDSLKNLFKDKAAADARAGDPDTHKREGKAHVRNANWEGAVRSFREALATGGEDADVLVSLAFALLEQGDAQEARGALERAIACAPGNADAHYMLGSILRDSGDRDSAIAHYRKAVQLQPQLAPAYKDLAILLVDSAQLDDAATAIKQGIAVDPGSAEFRMVLGNILDRAKDSQGAVAAYQSALSIQPNSPELHNNMGNALRALGRVGPAMTSYRTALSFKPDFADAHVNIANAMRDEGNLPEALVHFKEAIAAKPDSVQAIVGAADVLAKLNQRDESLGLLREALVQNPDERTLLLTQATALMSANLFDEAMPVIRRMIHLQPNFVNAHVALGNALMQQGKHDHAVAAFRRVIELDPGNPVIHMISALSGNSTERAPDEYVAWLFDFYAEKFDSHLVSTLKYNIPQEIAELLRATGHASRGRWDVLDLGCGTGLAGAAIGDDAKHVVGVDLSPKMLDKARARNLYARLECSDLLAMMQKEPPTSYDVIVAADVFVYIGKLDELTSEVHRLLRPGGLFAFSVEATIVDGNEGQVTAEGLGYQLNDTGRYSHSKRYVEQLAEAGEFTPVEIRDATVRVNSGKPVPGYVALFRR